MVCVCIAAGGCADRGVVGDGGIEVDVEGLMVIKPVARLGPGAGKEISGIVRSRRDPTVFWTLNDSGDEPRLYPVRLDGTVVASTRYPEVPGVLVGGAINVDWEAIAMDASGRVVIADLGNNSNARADLTLYFVEEPEATEGRTSATSKILVRYPDQPSRPAPRENFNFDAEGVFTVGDEIFILTKHRSDTATKLYRVGERRIGVVNDLEFVERFEIAGQVTGADASPDGLRLAVLTYGSIWLFERKSVSESFFRGVAYERRYRMEDGKSDSEAICFGSDDELVIADEARGLLYRVPVEAVRAGGRR